MGSHATLLDSVPLHYMHHPCFEIGANLGVNWAGTKNSGICQQRIVNIKDQARDTKLTINCSRTLNNCFVCSLTLMW